MTWDSITDKTLKDLLPEVKIAAESAINELHDIHKMNVRGTWGYRTFKEQDGLFAIGRTVDLKAPKKTNAKGGQSIHNYRMAIDVVEVSPQYGYGPKYDVKRWDIIAEVFKKYGFAWGGDWTSFRDRPHFEMTFGHSLKDIQKMYEEQGQPMYLKV